MTSSATVRLAILLGIVFVIVGGGARGVDVATCHADESRDLLRDASAKVRALKKGLRDSGSANTTLIARLDVARAAMDRLAPPAKPDLIPVDSQAGAQQQEIGAEEDKRRLERWMRACRDYRKREEQLRNRWVAGLEEAVMLRKMRRQTERNFRTEVNQHALELLVATGREDAATAAARLLTWALDKPMRPWPGILLGELMEAVNRLRSLEALDVLRQLLSSRVRLMRLSGPGGGGEGDLHVRFLRVIASYEDMPGRLRRLLVRDLLAVYEPIEEEAARGGAVADAWSEIREAAVEATWRHAGRPTHGTGAPLVAMHELSDWFRRNRAQNALAWRD